MPAPKDPQKYEEWKKKISETSKGRKSANKGVPHTLEARKKMSEVRKGKPSPNKGKKISEEQKRKISESSKGRVAWNKGIPHSEEQRKKLSEAKKRFFNSDRSKDWLEKHAEVTSKRFKGTIKSEEHKRKISQGNKGVSRGVGRIISEKQKAKFSVSMKKFYKSEAGRKHREKMSALVSQMISDGRYGNGIYKDGVYFSSKAGKVRHRSSWELLFFQKLDCDETVETYLVEKIRIAYEYNGMTKNYIPDLLITYTDGTQKLVEIKPEYLVNDPQNQAKFTAAQSLYPNFEVWTEKELETYV